MESTSLELAGALGSEEAVDGLPEGEPVALAPWGASQLSVMVTVTVIGWHSSDALGGAASIEASVTPGAMAPTVV